MDSRYIGGFGTYGAEALARMTGVGVRTARRWRQERRAPAPVIRLLEVLLDRALGVLHPAWDGWSLRADGRLHSPEGPSFAPGEVRAIPLRQQHIAALERAQRDHEREREREHERREREVGPERWAGRLTAGDLDYQLTLTRVRVDAVHGSPRAAAPPRAHEPPAARQPPALTNATASCSSAHVSPSAQSSAW